MPAVSSTLADLTSRRRDLSAPLITYYDMSTGERVELSGTTTANWVAKTSNMLIDDCEVEIGTRIRVALPSHWLRFVWLLSAWNVGAVIVDRDAHISVSGPSPEGSEPHRYAASLRPMGGRFVDPLPSGFLDLAIEVPGHSDHFTSFDPPAADDAAIELNSVAPVSHGDLLERVESDGRRVVLEPGALADDAHRIIAACLGDGSLVIVSSATPEQLERVATQESGQSVPRIP